MKAKIPYLLRVIQLRTLSFSLIAFVVQATLAIEPNYSETHTSGIKGSDASVNSSAPVKNVPVEKTLTEQARAKSILRKIDDLWRGKSSHAITKMHVKTRNYSRTMRMEGWSKGKELTLLRVLEPKKERGTATLKSGTSIYTYLPKTDRKIRLTSGMMMGSWMGSHLTNDDLVKESRLEDDYDIHISYEGPRNEQTIIEFSLIPKTDAAIVWGKLILEVDQARHTPIRERYYDEDMLLVRTIEFSHYALLAGKERPSVMTVTPADKPGEFTQFTYESLELGLDLDDQFFSVARLKRR
jgi:hypothetical protein